MFKDKLCTQVTMSHLDRTFTAYLWKEGKRVLVLSHVAPISTQMGDMSREAAQIHSVLQGFEEAYDYIVGSDHSWYPNLETTWSILEQTQNYLSESK